MKSPRPTTQRVKRVRKPNAFVERITVPAGEGFPKITKDVIFMVGRGENCQCYDCPVLYGGDCPYDEAPALPKQRTR